jgi:hypothetical protein
MYVRERNEPPFFMRGERRLTIETSEYALTPTAER